MISLRVKPYLILTVLGTINIGLLVMNAWCRHQVCVMQQSIEKSLQYYNNVETEINITPIAHIQKFIRTPHPRPDQVKDLLNHQFKIYHVRGDQRPRGASHLCISVRAELDSDIYAWLQDLQYYGFQANYIALFFDDINAEVIGKIYLKCPDHRAGYHSSTNQAS